MKTLRTFGWALLMAAALIPHGWTDHHQVEAESKSARAERYFDTQGGFYFNVEHVKRRSGKITAMITLVSKEDFAVCSNEIALDGTPGDSLIDLTIKGIHHPVRFYMDTRGPATGAYYLDSPSENYTLRIAYHDGVDVWQVEATDSSLVVEPVDVSFTEQSAIWPPGKSSAVRGR